MSRGQNWRDDDSYFLEYGGERLFGGSATAPEDILDHLYSSPVEDVPEPKNLNMRQLCERVLDRAGIVDRVTSEYYLPVMLKKGFTDRAHFDYRYENGAVHPIKRVTITYEVERSWESIHAAVWDFEKVASHLDSGESGSIALVKAHQFDSDLETQMGYLAISPPLNIGQVDHAAYHFTELLHLSGEPALR